MKPMRNTMPRGFTLLEVLVALLIFSFGMLGLAALQAQSIKVNQGASMRSQATGLSNIMLDNVRANRGNLVSYYSDAYTALGQSTSCASLPTGAAPSDDRTAWLQQVGCELPNGAGGIAPLGSNMIAVCLRWSDSRLQSGTAHTRTCSQDAQFYNAGTTGTGSGVDGDQTVFVVVATL